MNQSDQILKKEMMPGKKVMIGISVGMALFYTLSIVFCFLIHDATHSIIRNQAIRNIANISQLNKDSISRAIESRRIAMEIFASRVEKTGNYDIDTVIDDLSDYQKTYNFYNMGLMDENKVLYLINNSGKIVPDPDFAEEIWDDQFHLVESRASRDENGYMVNSFSCPIYRDGEIAFVLLATYRSSDLTGHMNISSLEGMGDTFLVDKEGKVVIYPHHYEDEEYNALMKYINDTPSIIPSEGGDQYFKYNNEKYFAHFEELGINGWYLMTCAGEKAVSEDALAITLIIYISILVLWLIIFFVIGGILYSIRRNRLRRTRETFYDDLLNIPNKQALSVVYEKMPRHILDKMYMAVFDIDKFKEFNYIYGSENGDRLLKYIADTIREVSPDACLFRYMSDYFIILSASEGREEYKIRMHRVLDRFKHDIEAGIISPFDISAGVRKIEPGEALSQTFSDALVARDTIKGSHLQHYAFYDENVRNKRLKYVEIESGFSAALRNKEFKVYYQPKYDMNTGEIVGAEALARWVKPDGTVISPGDFIPCLESSRQIILLDEEILSEVCRQMNEMETEGLEVKRVSVNLSRVHLRNPGILNKIAQIIDQFNVNPAKLSFEITETVLYEDSIPLKMIVDNLHNLGCKVEMDDYGVGVSGPNSLAQNNFDVVKLDKSLADGLGNERVEDVIRSTAHMARKWGMAVLVEGVEERSQAERLVELGCSYAQGFCFAKPMPEADYRKALSESADSSGNRQKVSVRLRSFPEDVSALLDGYSQQTYIIDPESFVLMYSNQAMCRYLGSNPTGGLCYKKLRGKDKPCDDCPAMWLYRDGNNMTKEVFGIDGRWAMLVPSFLYWEGRTYVQISRVDITKQKKMETELTLRSREYEAIVRKNIVGVMRYDIASNTATLNVDRNLDRVEEYTISDYVRKVTETGLILPDSTETIKALLDDVRSGMPSKGYNINFFTQRDGLRRLHFDYALVKDDDGKPCRAVISFFDNAALQEKKAGL